MADDGKMKVPISFRQNAHREKFGDDMRPSQVEPRGEMLADLLLDVLRR
jgi:hypothetical protein